MTPEAKMEGAENARAVTWPGSWHPCPRHQGGTGRAITTPPGARRLTERRQGPSR
jgi:hypothetical protein